MENEKKIFNWINMEIIISKKLISFNIFYLKYLHINN